MLKIINQRVFHFEWLPILVLGLCLMSFACRADDFKFIRTCVVHFSYSLAAGDEKTIAKHDLAVLKRCYWNDINGNTWVTLKGINPGIKIYLYELGSEINDNYDTVTLEYLDNLGRWNNRRASEGGPGTNVNQDHPEFFLLDSNNSRIYNTSFTNSWRMDIGLAAYQNYWLQAAINDVVNQTWVADGIFLDNCITLWTLGSGNPATYPTNASWISAMHGFINVTTSALHAVGQKTFCNRGFSRTADGYNAFIALDSIANPPDAAMEEGAFVVGWASSDAQFYPEADWKRQVDVLGAVHNYKIAHVSHCKLASGGSGTDNYGKPVTYYDALWYALCSYQLGKNEINDNSYFAFPESDNYSLLSWYDEFDNSKLNLGRAAGPYQIKVISGNNIYMREFTNGYVYVNPTANDVTSVGLKETCKQLNHDNFENDPSTIANVTSISLPSHRGTILLKSSQSLPGTVYEDAENGNTAGWSVYDNTGTISNVYDAERAGRVIQLAGNGTSTGFQKLTDVGIVWNNSAQFAVEWKMKYSAPIIVYLRLDTSAGTKYLAYYSNAVTEGGTGQYVSYNLGAGAVNGKWHTITRDLKADLAKYQPTVTLNSVTSFLIRGSGYIDDILLRQQDTVYEDAENGNTAGWSIYDSNTTGTITNVDDSSRGGKIIRLTGNQSNTGFIKQTDAGANWNNTSQFTLEWSMKTSVSYYIFALVNTSAGDIYLTYTSAGYDTLGTGNYIWHGLGSNTTNGQWQTIVRDLNADLKEAQPGVTLNSVKAFLIRTGSADIDDIKLREK